MKCGFHWDVLTSRSVISSIWQGAKGTEIEKFTAKSMKCGLAWLSAPSALGVLVAE
jgi:hypothetical protein